MGGAHVLVDAARLITSREPFVLVSVVWRRGPSSGQVGGKAIILADGTIQGWIGGACAEPTVIERALACLESGQPEMLLLGEGSGVAFRQRDGAAAIPMACESDGALEVYMEPFAPPVRVVVIGRSPAVDTLASMALRLGWDALIVDDGGSADEHDEPSIVHTKLALDEVVIDGATAVVVATQGHYDDLALGAALATPAGYIGLVASARRAAGVLDQLRSDGVTEQQLARVHAPAGLDLGAIQHVEIAASVLADLVGRRAAGELERQGGVAHRAVATDPICGMTVHPDECKYHSLHADVDYWFCASGCKRAFDADPEGALSS